jgi:hypothetical protein
MTGDPEAALRERLSIAQLVREIADSRQTDAHRTELTEVVLQLAVFDFDSSKAS